MYESKSTLLWETEHRLDEEVPKHQTKSGEELLDWRKLTLGLLKTEK